MASIASEPVSERVDGMRCADDRDVCDACFPSTSAARIAPQAPPPPPTAPWRHLVSSRHAVGGGSRRVAAVWRNLIAAARPANHRDHRRPSPSPPPNKRARALHDAPSTAADGEHAAHRHSRATTWRLAGRVRRAFTVIARVEPLVAAKTWRPFGDRRGAR